MKIRTVGAESFNADRRKDGRTDRNTYMTKQIIAFRNFAEAPNKLTDLSDIVCPPPASSFSPFDLFALVYVKDKLFSKVSSLLQLIDC